jgi:hypothetical protein
LVVEGRLVEDQYWGISQHWEHVKIGDDMFIYTGAQDLGIIGYAKIKNVEKRSRGWCVKPEFDLSKCQMLLKNPIPAHVIRGWELMLRRNPIDLSSRALELYSHVPWASSGRLPEEVPDASNYCEGSVQRILVNRYERDPRAREECIRRHGSTCILCGFDFVAKYGPIMEGFIHVHHLKPLSGLGADYKVDPIQDLIHLTSRKMYASSCKVSSEENVCRGRLVVLEHKS